MGVPQPGREEIKKTETPATLSRERNGEEIHRARHATRISKGKKEIGGNTGGSVSLQNVFSKMCRCMEASPLQELARRRKEEGKKA